MLYSLLPLGLAKGYESSKHTQLISWCKKNYIHSKKIEPEYEKMTTKAYNHRTKEDSDVFVAFEKFMLMINFFMITILW